VELGHAAAWSGWLKVGVAVHCMPLSVP
jgi:hypothetical protein